jgi:hypothetical protein
MLNLQLYNALRTLYGNVSVLQSGNRGDYVKQYSTKVVNGVSRERVQYVVSAGGNYGETYQLRCPFCGDHKPRMYIRYIFGIRDEKTKTRNIFTWKCYNEECQQYIDNCIQLLEDVDLVSGANGLLSDSIEQGVIQNVPIADRDIIIRPMPGDCVRLTEIDESSEFYPAVKYLRDERRYSLEVLDQNYGVRVISQHYGDKRVQGRILTPFIRCGYRIGWNARAVPGFSENNAEKYVNSSGGLSGVCYGLLGAIATKVVIIVEGVTDKWAVGQNGVAVLGKKLTQATISRLVSELMQSDVELVLILMDPERSPDDIKHDRPHHSEVAKSRLSKFWPGRVEVVYLPDDLDPSAAGGIWLAGYLYNIMRSLGYDAAAEAVASTVRMSTATR